MTGGQTENAHNPMIFEDVKEEEINAEANPIAWKYEPTAVFADLTNDLL